MAAFGFQAMNGGGKPQPGVMEAASAAAALAALRSRDLLPPEVTASTTAPATRGPRLPLAALTLVTRQMATLLRSGLRIEDRWRRLPRGKRPGWRAS